MFDSEAITTKIFKKKLATTIQQEFPDIREWGRWEEENWLPHWTCPEDASMVCSIAA